MTLHAAVLGTGGWSRVHLGALQASPHVGQVTLVGRNEARRAELAAQFSKVRRTLAEPDAVWSDASVSVVHVVLPHHLHAATTQAALASGKDVICEKPAATRLADFDAAVAQAAQRGRRLLVVMNQLYNPVVWAVRRLVDEGTLGRVFLSVENSYSDAAANYRRLDYWRNSPDLAGGGVLLDGGFHMVYRHLHYLESIGWPEWVLADAPQLAVSADGAIVPSKGEDFVAAVAGYAAPLRLQWAHGWTLAAAPARARQSFLAGTEGTLELTDRPDEPLVLHARGSARAVAVEQGPHTGPTTTHACLLDYLDCLATGRPPERASLDLARTALATVLGIYASARAARRELIS